MLPSAMFVRDREPTLSNRVSQCKVFSVVPSHWKDFRRNKIAPADEKLFMS